MTLDGLHCVCPAAGAGCTVRNLYFGELFVTMKIFVSSIIYFLKDNVAPIFFSFSRNFGEKIT